jgi:hypothetical protein
MPEEESLEQRAFYEDKGKRIRFVQSPMEHGAYDVFVGKDHFYIPDRVVPDLGSPTGNMVTAMRGLEAMNPGIPFILKTNGVSNWEFYAALLHVRNLELEAEIENIISISTIDGMD